MWQEGNYTIGNGLHRYWGKSWSVLLFDNFFFVLFQRFIKKTPDGIRSGVDPLAESEIVKAFSQFLVDGKIYDLHFCGHSHHLH